MESVEMDMEDIFAEPGGEDEDFPIIPPLADLPEETEGGGEGEQDEENIAMLAKLKDLSKGAAKKVVRRPIPKLDGARLTGERGIAVLPKVFEKVKFKGKGHEADDLRIVMRYLEHWAHRLFPKMPFDEVLERIERLGTKKEVQTCIKRMRMDMPLVDEDFISRGDDDQDNVLRGHDGDVDGDADDAWDEIMREEGERRKASQPQPVATTSYSQPQSPPAPSTPTAMPVGNNSPQGLTPDQIHRIEENKRRAMEKRAAKLGGRTPGTPFARSQPSTGSRTTPVASTSQMSASTPPPASSSILEHCLVNSNIVSTPAHLSSQNHQAAVSLNEASTSRDEEMVDETAGTRSDGINSVSERLQESALVQDGQQNYSSIINGHSSDMEQTASVNGQGTEEDYIYISVDGRGDEQTEDQLLEALEED